MIFRSRKRDEDREYARLLAQETLILDVTEEICRLLEEEGLTRHELANRLGKSKGSITQLLSGERNMTLRTVADLAHALGHRFRVRAVSDEEDVRSGGLLMFLETVSQSEGRGAPKREGSVRSPIRRDKEIQFSNLLSDQVRPGSQCESVSQEADHEYSLIA